MLSPLLRERTEVDSYEGLGLTLPPSEGTSTVQVRGKPGSARKARNHCHRDPQRQEIIVTGTLKLLWTL